jgi:hypothetical protein
MATVNLGSIKFKWKGTYSGATAYTVDDVVEYNGSSYICILASTGNLPTNATYFEQMSSAGTNGTNGTDLTTTLTTQGDLVYRDGSGLQRLGAGTAGQALITGGSGANPSWGDAGGGKVNQVIQSTMSTMYDVNINAQWVNFPNDANSGAFTATITPSDTSSKILVLLAIRTMIPAGNVVRARLLRDGSASGYQGNASGSRPLGYAQYYFNNGTCDIAPLDGVYLDSPNSTSALNLYNTNWCRWYICNYWY